MRRALAILCLVLAGPASAQAFGEADAARHRTALGLFERACLYAAPGFAETQQVFAQAGMARPENSSSYREPGLGIYGAVVPVQAGQVFGQQCTVMLERGHLAVMVIGLRTAISRFAISGSVNESAPSRHTDPVLWDFRMPRIGAVSVTAGLAREGIGVIAMQVADRVGDGEASQ
ncbi:MAG: hypothetical protein AAGI70_04145 [Pseudomonadota bacterium]